VADYANHAQTWERDPVITPMGLRTEVPSGKRGRWGRYNDPASLVWVDTVFGRSVSLTRNQADIYGAMKLRAGTGIRVTMRELAAELHLAASTIWRAMIRLTALGLIVYQTNRGKYGGTMFRLAEVGDTLDWLRDEAKARLRAWWKASEDRISRLRSNVASCFPGREQELYQYRSSSSSSTERNIRIDYPEWTPQDFREAGLM
jgi:predicted transcriptional regulator